MTFWQFCLLLTENSEDNDNDGGLSMGLTDNALIGDLASESNTNIWVNVTQHILCIFWIIVNLLDDRVEPPLPVLGCQ